MTILSDKKRFKSAIKQIAPGFVAAYRSRKVKRQFGAEYWRKHLEQTFDTAGQLDAVAYPDTRPKKYGEQKKSLRVRRWR